MNVVEITTLEDCFDGTFMKELRLDSCVTKAFIEYLGKGYTLHYYSTFARPFYHIVAPGKYSIKGVEGNLTLRVLFQREKKEENLCWLIDRINNYSKTF